MNIQFIEKAFDDGKLTIEEFREEFQKGQGAKCGA
jgi:hypothetical protein